MRIFALVADQAYARTSLAIPSIRGMVWASEVTHDKGGRTDERTQG